MNEIPSARLTVTRNVHWWKKSVSLTVTWWEKASVWRWRDEEKASDWRWRDEREGCIEGDAMTWNVSLTLTRWLETSVWLLSLTNLSLQWLGQCQLISHTNESDSGRNDSDVSDRASIGKLVWWWRTRPYTITASLANKSDAQRACKYSLLTLTPRGGQSSRHTPPH